MMRLATSRGWSAALVALLALFALAAAPRPARAAELRRMALLVANHQGGAGTVELRYARTDAEKLGSVLAELGGFAPGDVYYLFDATADEARAALVEVERRVAQAAAEGAETTLLVYYSGHARAGALRMGDTAWPMVEVRRALAASRASVRIGIIDACQSGAITRAKGGRPGPSFVFTPDDGQPARGLVLISSSSDDEDSQESDQLGGSYFTHYLASGLRGDADESGDHRVTLAEMYGYAYHKTITETVETRSGVQHPSYSYDLQGSGNLVLSDLGRGQSGVYFGPGLDGDYLILDQSREQVAAEVRKVSGQARRIALPPGDYLLKRRLADHLEVQRFQLTVHSDHVVDPAAMEPVPFEEEVAKGGRAPGVHLGMALRGGVQSFLSADTRATLFPPVLLLGGAVTLSLLEHLTLAAEVSVGTRADAPLQLDTLALSYDFLEVVSALELIGRWPVGRHLGLDGLDLLGGPRLAGVYFRRAFPQHAELAAQDHFTLSPALVGGVGYGFGRGGHLRVDVVGRVGLLPFSVDENRALFYAETALVVGVSL